LGLLRAGRLNCHQEVSELSLRPVTKVSGALRRGENSSEAQESCSYVVSCRVSSFRVVTDRKLKN
jgi:hypothetical protein